MSSPGINRLGIHQLGAATLLCTCLSLHAQAQTSMAVPAGGVTTVSQAFVPDGVHPLDVTVNGAKAGTWVLIEKASELYAPEDAFEAWRVVRHPDAQAFEVLGQAHYKLSSVPGFEARTDLAAQALALTFAPEAFSATRLVQQVPSAIQVHPVLPSVFLNYDFSYNRRELKSTSAFESLGMLGELGTSGDWGVFTTSFSGRNLLRTPETGASPAWTRLETSFVRNYPEHFRTLRLGDSSTASSLMGRRTYFGGVQVGSNFALNPSFLTQPQPALGGLSSAPSTVELYINDVLRQVSSVPAGPFALENMPMLTGNGEARLVVRDLLGRETVLVQSFLASPQLLAAGLSDWSLSAGRQRKGLGAGTTEYRDNFVSGLWRHGVNGRMTLEGQVETQSGLRTLGVGAAGALPWQILGRAGWGVSRSQASGQGQQWLLGAEHQGLRASTTLQAQGSSANFRQIGQEQAPARLQLAGSFSYSTRELGSFGFGFAASRQHAGTLLGDRIVTASLNYSVRVGTSASLNFNISRARGNGSFDGGTAWGLTLIQPLGPQLTATASTQRRGPDMELMSTLSRNPTGDETLGWRLLAGQHRGTERAEGGLYKASAYGNLSADLSVSQEQNALRLGGTGGLVLAGGHLFATPRVDSSYALVELAGLRDVRVGLGSNMLARTNSKGLALVPRLVAYQTNYIRLDASDVPFTADIESLEKTTVPGQRSAVKVVFAVRGGRAALLSIVLDDGLPAPAGAVVRLEGDPETFYVARRGEAYVTGLAATQRLSLTWRGRSCNLSIDLPPANQDIPRLGPLSCQGVLR